MLRFVFSLQSSAFEIFVKCQRCYNSVTVCGASCGAGWKRVKKEG